MERFIEKDFEYEQIINDLIKTNLENLKYTSGDELLSEIFEDVPKKKINRSYFDDLDR